MEEVQDGSCSIDRRIKNISDSLVEYVILKSAKEYLFEDLKIQTRSLQQKIDNVTFYQKNEPRISWRLRKEGEVVGEDEDLQVHREWLAKEEEEILNQCKKDLAKAKDYLLEGCVITEGIQYKNETSNLIKKKWLLIERLKDQHNQALEVLQINESYKNKLSKLDADLKCLKFNRKLKEGLTGALSTSHIISEVNRRNMKWRISSAEELHQCTNSLMSSIKKLSHLDITESASLSGLDSCSLQNECGPLLAEANVRDPAETGMVNEDIVEAIPSLSSEAISSLESQKKGFFTRLFRLRKHCRRNDLENKVTFWQKFFSQRK